MSAELVQRLEIIQQAIALGEADLILTQAAKLQGINGVSGLPQLVELLRAEQYVRAAEWIADFRQNHLAVTPYESPELAALRLQLKALEDKLVALNEQKSDQLQHLNTFNSQYMQQLGELLQAILHLELRLARHKVAQAAAQPDGDDLRSQFEHAQHEYESFKQERAHTLKRKPFDLDAQDQAKLKQAYRQASRLCHPDKLAPEARRQGTETFQQLSAAYEQQDLQRVQQIYAELKAHRRPDSPADQPTDADKLRDNIEALQQSLDKLRADMADFNASTEWQLLESLGDDWQPYFDQQRVDLESRLAELRQQAEQLGIRG